MAAQPVLVNLRCPPRVRLTCQPSLTANSIRARSRLWPRDSSCALATGPPGFNRTWRTAGHAGESVLPLREQFAGERAHGVERSGRNSAWWLSILDAMHRHAAGCSARIGFDGRHVGAQHADARVILK